VKNLILNLNPVNEDEPEIIVADVTRIKNELFWQPAFDLSTGPDKTIDWWKENICLINEMKIIWRIEEYLCWRKIVQFWSIGIRMMWSLCMINIY
jgi:hypothetical protein